MSRNFIPVYTYEELVDACLHADLEKARKSTLAYYSDRFTSDLVGKEFPCSFNDETRMTFRFPEIHTVEWSENGGDFHTEYCEPIKSSAGNIYGVHFFRRHVLPFEGAYVVFDLDTGFTTWVSMKIGKDNNDKDVHTFPHFGEIEGVGTHEGQRHYFSNEFVGTVIDWKYNDQFSIRHSYVTPNLTISADLPHEDENEEFIERRFLPAFHVKIRDKLLLTSFVEPGGCAAVLLIDMKIVHDIGCFYGIGGDGKLSSITLAAIGGFGGPGLKAEVGYAKPLLDC